MDRTVAPPGSAEAQSEGCICPAEENREGQGVAHLHSEEEGKHYCIAQECPIHGFQPK